MVAESQLPPAELGETAATPAWPGVSPSAWSPRVGLSFTSTKITVFVPAFGGTAHEELWL